MARRFEFGAGWAARQITAYTASVFNSADSFVCSTSAMTTDTASGSFRLAAGFTKDFQRNSVVDYLILKKPLEWISSPLCISANLLDPNTSDGYCAFLYHPRDAHECEEGFGPSVTVRIGDDDTVWKRSRNKWNPFEKIPTIDGVDNDNFNVMWDRNKANSFYLLSRMYYYLDKEKQKERFNGLRGKLYITRMQQKSNADSTFLLQFIVEQLSDDQIEVIRSKEDKKRKKINAERRASEGDIEDGAELTTLLGPNRQAAGLVGVLPGINRLLNPLGAAHSSGFGPESFDSLANAAALRGLRPNHLGSLSYGSLPEPTSTPFVYGVPAQAQVQQQLPVKYQAKRVLSHVKSRSIEQEPAARWRNKVSQQTINTAAPSASNPDSMDIDGARSAKRRSIDAASLALAGLSDIAASMSSRSASPSPGEMSPSTAPPSPSAIQQPPQQQYGMPNQFMSMFPFHPQFAFSGFPPFAVQMQMPPAYGFPDPSAMQVDSVGGTPSIPQPGSAPGMAAFPPGRFPVMYTTHPGGPMVILPSQPGSN